MSAPLTRRHFTLVADKLRDAIELAQQAQCAPSARHILIYLAHEFTRDFQRSNARFDRERFLRACGLRESEMRS